MSSKELIVPIVTPRNNGELDLESLRTLTVSLIDRGVTGLFVLGTNGEFQYLTLEQKLDVLKTVVAAAGTRVPLFVGISADTVEETRALMKAAKEHNVAALVFTPMYGQRDIAQKKAVILEESILPVLLYNNQHITNGNNIPFSYIADSKENERFIGIKDSSGDLEYLKSLLTLKSDSFTILHGEERNALDAVGLGVHGLVSGSSNVFPETFLEFLGNPSAETFSAIQAIHKNIESLDANYIKGIKIKLVEEGVIHSSEMWS